MKSIGIIDLGSNSLKLLIAEQKHSKKINVLFEKKHQIRLSDYYIDDIPNLSAIGIYKLILSIQSFKEKCKLFECDKIIVVATETLRKCANKDVILNEIKKETGFEVRILSGYEESYLGYVSTVNTLDYSNYFLVDMGGASVEIALVKNNKFKHYASLPLGPIPLSSRFNLFNKISPFTKNEFKILHYLLINRGKIVSRVDILDYLWDSALFVNDNTLTVNITRIRNKMEELGIKDYIKTKRGQGYMI